MYQYQTECIPHPNNINFTNSSNHHTFGKHRNRTIYNKHITHIHKRDQHVSHNRLVVFQEKNRNYKIQHLSHTTTAAYLLINNNHPVCRLVNYEIKSRLAIRLASLLLTTIGGRILINKPGIYHQVCYVYKHMVNKKIYPYGQTSKPKSHIDLSIRSVAVYDLECYEQRWKQTLLVLYKGRRFNVYALEGIRTRC